MPEVPWASGETAVCGLTAQVRAQERLCDRIMRRWHLPSHTRGSSAGVPVLVCVLVSHCQFVILSVGARDSVTCFLSDP